MKKLLLVALMLSFLAGNAQQARQQYGQDDSKKAQVQLNTDNNPEHPISWDIYRYSDMKPDNLDLPCHVDVYKSSIRLTENLEGPVHFDRYRYANRKTENLGTPYHVNVNRYTNRIID